MILSFCRLFVYFFQSEHTHHLTIGPSGGAEWAKRLKEEGEIHKSTDCIIPKVTRWFHNKQAKRRLWLIFCFFFQSRLIVSFEIGIFQDASCSDSDLLKSSPMWPPRPRSPTHSSHAAVKGAVVLAESSLSDSARSVSSQEADDAAKGIFPFCCLAI